MDAQLHAVILRLLNECKDMTLATVRADGAPQANIVNFAHDGLVLYFATDRGSEKVSNMLAFKKVAVALRPEYDDWTTVKGLSIAATAEVLTDDSAESQLAKDCLTRRFARAEDTPSPQDPTTTLFVKLTPQRISVSDYSKGYGHRDVVLVDPSN